MSFSLSTLPIGSPTGGTVILGDMVLLGFEVPERITYGGAQRPTIHRLPGGDRVIDLLGDDPEPITWSGIFLGIGSEQRRQQLDAIRTAGVPVLLAWNTHALTVVVVDCQFDEGFQQTGYRIACEVLPDPQPDDDADWATGDGETPSTPTAARDAGQSMATNARTSASPVPLRTVSATRVGDFDPTLTSFG